MAEDLSTRELSRLSGLASEGHAHAIECGDRPNPTSETIASLATVLGADPGWLAFGSGKSPVAKSVRAAVEEARAKRSAA